MHGNCLQSIYTFMAKANQASLFKLLNHIYRLITK
jgi:hypothetical protein